MASRRVLLDALAALRSHGQSLVVVGAQAISLRAEAADLPDLASFTSDADLSIDPRSLEDDPRLEHAMTAAGFTLTTPPGTWTRMETVGAGKTAVAVDLLVPRAFNGLAPRSARGGRIPPHARTATRLTDGLEAAAVDLDVLVVRSLDGRPDASAQVAGVAALLVAKSHKIADRIAGGRPDRLQDKDAGDVIRLMQIGEGPAVAERFRTMLEDPDVGQVVRHGLALLRSQFGTPRAEGTRMATAALDGTLPRPLIEALAPAFLAQLPGG